MHIVVKGASSIAEYKQVKTQLHDAAKRCFGAHKEACDEWIHGDVAKVWMDGSGNVCIEYADGHLWHYNSAGEWW